MVRYLVSGSSEGNVDGELSDVERRRLSGRHSLMDSLLVRLFTSQSPGQRAEENDRHISEYLKGGWPGRKAAAPPLLQEGTFTCIHSCARMLSLREGLQISEADFHDALPSYAKSSRVGLGATEYEAAFRKLGFNTLLLHESQVRKPRMWKGKDPQTGEVYETPMYEVGPTPEESEAFIRQELGKGRQVVCGRTVFFISSHALLVTGIDDTHVFYNDPADGKGKSSTVRGFMRKVVNLMSARREDESAPGGGQA